MFFEASSTSRTKEANNKTRKLNVREVLTPLAERCAAKRREGAVRKGGFISPVKRTSPMGCGAEPHVREKWDREIKAELSYQ